MMVIKMKCLKDGCKANATSSGYCYWHCPERAEERQQACSDGGKARLADDKIDDSVLELTDIKKILSKCIRKLNISNDKSIGKYRAIGYLAGVYITNIQQVELEARVVELEKKLAG
jgi:hypothetical protein